MVKANEFSDVIIAGQSSVLYFYILGAFLGVAHMILAPFRVTNATCICKQLLGHLSYGMVFSVLFSKTWRVHLLVDNKFHDIVMISDYVNTVTGIGLVIQTVLVIVLLCVALPHRTVVETHSGNQTLRVGMCSFRNPTVSTVLLALEGFSLVLGARMCWLTRGATEAVNATGLGKEGAHLFINKNVMLAIYTMIMICVVEFAALYLTKLTVFDQVLVVNIGFFVALLSATLCVFVPKFLALYFPSSKSGQKVTEVRGTAESQGSTPALFIRLNSAPSVHT